jgi:multidrug efflux pump subunit AcrA (membrane-fusion protein)
MKYKAIFIFLLAGFLPACGNGEKTIFPEAPKQVRGAAVKIREIPHEVKGFGTISYLKKIDLAAPADAVLKTLRFREGDRIRQGEAAAILENPWIILAVGRAENACSQAQAALDLAGARLLEGEFRIEAQLLNIEKAETELAQSRRVYEEQKRKHLGDEALFEAGGLSEETIRDGRFALETGEEQLRLMEKELDIRRIGLRDEDLSAAGISPPEDEKDKRRALINFGTLTLQAELNAAKASLEAASKELESARLVESGLVIRSPASGTVGARYFEEGERVKGEDKILTLIDTESFYALFPLPEAEALMLEKGMAAEVRIDGTGGIYQGQVDLVFPQADSQSFTFLVRALLPGKAASGPEGGTLKPGMFARVTVTLGPSRSVVVVPESSLVQKENGRGTVFLISGEILTERKVSLGEVLDGDREIKSGLAPGEVVVLRPSADLREGVYVSALD